MQTAFCRRRWGGFLLARFGEKVKIFVVNCAKNCINIFIIAVYFARGGRTLSRKLWLI